MMRHEDVTLTRYNPHPRNYNGHSEKQLAKLKASLEKFGQVRSIVVWRDFVLAGHGLREAAMRLGWATLRADILPDDYPEDRALGYVVADNEIARHSDPDQAALAAILDDLQRADPSLTVAAGFTDQELHKLLNQIGGKHGKDTEPQISKAEALGQKWSVEPGQLWQLGDHRLICGDCTQVAVIDRLMAGQKAEMMFTDPPYGVSYTGGHFHSGNVKLKRERESLANDENSEIYSQFLPIILPHVDGPCYVWFADRTGKPVYDAILGNGCEIHAMIVWHKTNAKYAAMYAQYKQRHEPCMYFKPKRSTLRWIGPSDECTLWEIDRDAANEYRPTQKPIALPERAIGNHEAQIILDCFAGSGSTLIACENLGRACRAVEISPAYVGVILERWAMHTGEKPILHDS